MSDTSTKKDRWDKASILVTSLSMTAIPIVLGLAGHWVSASSSRQETNFKYVELAVGILQTDPVKTPKETREWAIKVLEKYSEVAVPAKTRTWLMSAALPEKQPTLNPAFIKAFEHAWINIPSGGPEVAGNQNNERKGVMPS